MLESIVKLQSEYLESKTDENKKRLGQFFTGAQVADYMASLVSIPKLKEVRILDAGAGAGILTVACVLRCIEFGCKEIHAVLYELDSEAISYTNKTMKLVSELCTPKCKFTYEVINQDFVLSRPDTDSRIMPFDVSIINPPYFKYNVKTSLYRKATLDLYKGNPNIYASFIAVVLASLKKNGQMVVISPRSFTNGLYFKGFRRFLNDFSSLERIHIFVSRNKIFKDSKVLQENIICKFVKREQSKSIEISTSQCNVDITESAITTYPKNLILDSTNGERMILIPDNQENANILLRAQKLESTFMGAGYFISTGPVVGFRTRKYISSKNKLNDSVPLLRPHNIKPLEVVWSGEHGKDAHFRLKGNYNKHLLENNTYVLLKRFSSKDEKRRLVGAVHNPKSIQSELIGFDNKLNYIGLKEGNLTLTEAFGLATLFNSTFMDKYFRCLSGNTQVNATEIRVLHFPARESVKEIGRIIKKRLNIKQNNIDEVVNSVLGLNDQSKLV